MAIISIEVDTSKKSSTVKVDGKKMGDVSNVYLSLNDFFNVEISQVESLDDDTHKVTRIVANTKFEEDAEASEEYPGLYKCEEKEKDFTAEDLSKAILRRTAK